LAAYPEIGLDDGGVLITFQKKLYNSIDLFFLEANIDNCFIELFIVFEMNYLDLFYFYQFLEVFFLFNLW
jgi:hypothetical protein